MKYKDLNIGQACLIRDISDEIILLKIKSDQETNNNVVIFSTTNRFPVGTVGGIRNSSIIEPIGFQVVYK